MQAAQESLFWDQDAGERAADKRKVRRISELTCAIVVAQTETRRVSMPGKDLGRLLGAELEAGGLERGFEDGKGRRADTVQAGDFGLSVLGQVFEREDAGVDEGAPGGLGELGEGGIEPGVVEVGHGRHSLQFTVCNFTVGAEPNWRGVFQKGQVRGTGWMVR